MAQVLQMPAMGLDTTDDSEESRKVEFDRRQTRARLDAKQQATQLASGAAAGIPVTMKETDEAIRMMRMMTALNPLTFIWWVIETTFRYLTANLMGLEWPGIWQKVSKVERWVMFGADGLLFIVICVALALLVLTNPAILAQLALDKVFGFFKDLGCQVFTCK